ncbi:unnamed protein product [Bursaphelenchus xylophilus]|uniref:(pine wood nematode) hypothetical protein n=1 Tax=Bursaphelenchus xylophilus TaxID=6326 RepID=A0A1I7SEC9_BURXY|nr:unnamed protein product [Bursaphelenchus xylophilus]CAG9087499.1 unnamed protein product [Bursaphelenchus xylophilus]
MAPPRILFKLDREFIPCGVFKNGCPPGTECYGSYMQKDYPFTCATESMATMDGWMGHIEENPFLSKPCWFYILISLILALFIVAVIAICWSRKKKEEEVEEIVHYNQLLRVHDE